MKKIIFRKISQDSLVFFLITIFSIGAIIWVLQAVNFLDVVIEDGHSIGVYLRYSLLNIPKILSKILPFAIFFSFLYIFLKYENNNELIILWNFGIHKKIFLNFFVKFSFLFVLTQLILTSYIVPKAQDIARSYIRDSNVDLFESMIKEKKFVDTVKNLTIYADEKNANGEYINIFLKESATKGSFQVTFADKGRFENRGNIKNLVLYNGKTISDNNGTINGFEFSRTEINMSGYDTKSTSIIKTQENKTSELINCLLKIKDIKKTEINKNNSVLFENCRTGNLENIILELYKRIISPFYIPVFILISLLIILRSKDQHKFNLYVLKIFILGISTIIFSEISVKFIVSDLYKNFPIIIMPFILFIIIYSFFSNQLKQ